MNTRRGAPATRPVHPSRAGRVLARCVICRAEAVADGTGRPVTLTHEPECPVSEAPELPYVRGVLFEPAENGGDATVVIDRPDGGITIDLTDAEGHEAWLSRARVEELHAALGRYLAATAEPTTFDNARDARESLEEMHSAVAHMLLAGDDVLAPHGDRLVDLEKALAEVESAVFGGDHE